MNDALIKGTGNSRYLKSVENFLALYPTYESFAEAMAAGTLPVDFNGINSLGWNQLGTALNKANLLSDAVAALFVDSDVSVPNDAFAALGKYAQHCWMEISGEAWVEYVEGRSDITSDYTFMSDGTALQCQISKSITIDQTTKEISLVDPTDYTLSPCNWRDADKQTAHAQEVRAALVPGYLKYNGAIWYFPSNSVFAYNNSYATMQFYYEGIKLNATSVGVKAQHPYATPVSHAAGSTQPVFSTNRNAYPDSGTVDGNTYLYMGIPLERLPGSLKIETGNYVGTGTYGASNPNSLTFDIAPQIVIILKNVADSEFHSGNVIIRGQTYSCGIGYNVDSMSSRDPAWHITWSEKGVEWYSTTGADPQLNEAETSFVYAAIGY